MLSGAKSPSIKVQQEFDSLLLEIAKKPENDYSMQIQMLIIHINFSRMKSLSLALFVSSRNYKQINIRESNKSAIFSAMQVILQECSGIQTLDFINPTFPPEGESVDLDDLLDQIAEDNGLSIRDPILYFNEWVSEFVDFVTSKTRINSILHAVYPIFLPPPEKLTNLIHGLAAKTKKTIGDQQMTGALISRFKLDQDTKQLVLSFLGDTDLFHRYLIHGANYDKLKMGMSKASLYKPTIFTRRPNYILNQLEASVRSMKKPPIEFQKLEGMDKNYPNMPELEDENMPSVEEVDKSSTGSLLDMDLTLKK